MGCSRSIEAYARECFNSYTVYRNDGGDETVKLSEDDLELLILEVLDDAKMCIPVGGSDLTITYERECLTVTHMTPSGWYNVQYNCSLISSGSVEALRVALRKQFL